MIGTRSDRIQENDTRYDQMQQKRIPVPDLTECNKNYTRSDLIRLNESRSDRIQQNDTISDKNRLNDRHQIRQDPIK